MPARGPLHGVPIALKDNIVTIDAPTTCASRILEGYVSPYEATAVTRLRAAGAIDRGQDQHGRVRHGLVDRALGLRPGASIRWIRAGYPAGRPAARRALVGAGVVPAALGSETGGSVRQPASFCGVVGVKPSYGRVSRFGLVAFGSSLDCISVFGRTVDDAARVLGAISGHDPLDATTLDRPPMPVPARAPRSHGPAHRASARVFPGGPRTPASRAGMDRTKAAVRELGAELVDVSLPNSAFAVPTYYIVAPAEAAANLARFDGVRYGPRKVGPDRRHPGALPGHPRRGLRRPRCGAASWWAPTC